MLRYRPFRNTDPPGLVEVWNEAFTGRGAVHLRSSSLLERFVFAKPYFDPAGLIIAEDEGACVGFAHAGFGPEPGGAGPGTSTGVICMLGVRPTVQRRGIGTALLRECEAYLRQRGATELFAGSYRPLNPFYQGMYGGSEVAGFLASDAAAEPFFARHNYEPCRTILVWDRFLKDPLKLVDTRFVGHRQQFDLKVSAPRSTGDWWQECVFNVVEPLEFYLEEKASGELAARTLVWEMEGFGERWRRPAVGLVDLHVPPKWRRRGLAKFLLALILRHIQEQYFEVAEVHIPEDNHAGIALCQALGFQQVDTGRVFRKTSGSHGDKMTG